MKAMYSALHKSWIVLNPERHELIIGSGAIKAKPKLRPPSMQPVHKRWTSPRCSPL